MPVRRRGRGGDPGIPGRPAGHVPLPDGSDLPTVPSHAAPAGPAPPPLAGPRGNLRAPDQRRPPPRTRRENLGYFKPRDGAWQSKVISMSVQVQPTSPGTGTCGGRWPGEHPVAKQNRRSGIGRKQKAWVLMQLEKLPWRGWPVATLLIFFFYSHITGFSTALELTRGVAALRLRLASMNTMSPDTYRSIVTKLNLDC
ncbi:hypothetical protein PVAP13_6KG362906 [Panicum virgatum]|uniref:Uncharacterized protein n=1 Tax=Panicum virgatum TaxID=38727 RepID=A0A8T0RHU4_PANVG|nr:hypothetical protein PVAP13_6KG362906 [Panicum virgatum]